MENDKVNTVLFLKIARESEVPVPLELLCL